MLFLLLSLFFIINLKVGLKNFSNFSGGGGTRTHKATGATGFQDRRISQFCHPSIAPNRIRTGISSLRSWCPNLLDDGGNLGREGFEPSRPFGHKVLSLVRLPVPPPALLFLLYHSKNLLIKLGIVKERKMTIIPIIKGTILE